MKNWEKIPRDKMIQVSKRKWYRLKEQVSWKLIKEIDQERKAIKQERETMERRMQSMEKALSHAQDMAIKWMDKFEATLESKL